MSEVQMKIENYARLLYSTELRAYFLLYRRDLAQNRVPVCAYSIRRQKFDSNNTFDSFSGRYEASKNNMKDPLDFQKIVTPKHILPDGTCSKELLWRDPS